MKKKNKLNKEIFLGFTIIEVMVSMSIFILVIIGIIQMFPIGVQIRKSAEQATIASNLARGKIETLVSQPYEEINIGEIEPRSRVSSDPEDPFYPYERKTVVSYVDPDNDLSDSVSDLGMKKIITTMFWKTRLGSQEKSLDIIILKVDL